MLKEHVKDWMTRDPLCVGPDTTLPEAHRLMTERRIRRLPVVENGKLVGIVTRGDIRDARPSSASSLSIWEMNYLLARLQVGSMMTRDPATICPDATIADAARMLLERKIGGLPVVDDDNHVVGIITESDIFRMVVTGWDKG